MLTEYDDPLFICLLWVNYQKHACIILPNCPGLRSLPATNYPDFIGSVLGLKNVCLGFGLKSKEAFGIWLFQSQNPYLAVCVL